MRHASSSHGALRATVVAAVLAASCGGSSSAPAAPSAPTAPKAPTPTITPQVAGNWTGRWVSDGWNGVTMLVDLAQSGDTVTGTWADTVAINWKGTVSGNFISPTAFTATVTFTSHGRITLRDTCTGVGTFTWNWDTSTGMDPMSWTGGFTWTGGACTCAGECLSYPAKATWVLRRGS